MTRTILGFDPLEHAPSTLRRLERTDACPACHGVQAGCRRCGGAGIVQVALPPIDRVTLTLPSGLGPRLAPADSIDAPQDYLALGRALAHLPDVDSVDHLLDAPPRPLPYPDIHIAVGPEAIAEATADADPRIALEPGPPGTEPQGCACGFRGLYHSHAGGGDERR